MGVNEDFESARNAALSSAADFERGLLHPWVQNWLDNPEQALRSLGEFKATDQVLQQMEACNTTSQNLRDLNQELLALIQRLKEIGTQSNFWTWFVGRQLEREVTLKQLAAEVETTATVCRNEAATMTEIVHRLASQIGIMKEEEKSMQSLIEGIRNFLDSSALKEQFNDLVSSDKIERLQRRMANFETLLTAKQLTRAQYQLAIDHGHAMLERYDEINTLLMPLWRQRMGFELFSQSLSTR